MIREFLYFDPPSGRRGIALFALRAFVGTAFLFHGYGKAADIPAFAAEFHIPLGIAAVAAWTQFAAGALLVAGFATPLTAMAIAVTMATATSQLIGRGEPFINPHGHSFESSSFYLVASFAIALLGPGAYSLDARLMPLLFARPDAVRGERRASSSR